MNVTFITARDGFVVLYAGDEMIAEASTAKDLADAIISKSLRFNGTFTSSTMDFADEEGFATYHGASDLLNSAFEIVNV